MEQPFDAFAYLVYLRSRWRFFTAACGAAALFTLAVSLAMTKRYTATVTLLIEPPEAAGPALASAEYLESLKIYEAFASGDAEFSRAAERFRLREAEPGASLATLKKRVLEVEKLRDTRLLEIRATLADPKQALEFAQYVAAEAVQLASQVANELAKRSLDDAEHNLAKANADFDRARAAMKTFTGEGAIEGLEVETGVLADLVTAVERKKIEAVAQEAAAEAGSGEKPRPDAPMRAARTVLDQQETAVRSELERKKAELGRLMSQRGALQTALDAAITNYESAEKRLDASRDSVRAQQGWLSILDAGAVPDRPSSPKPARNVVVALLLAGMASFVYLSAAYMAERPPADRPPRT